MNTNKTTLTLALTAVIGAAGLAHASDNPFSVQALSQGYMVADAGSKTMDGKCGEGKCGGSKTNSKSKAKAPEGKCGEGKCGGSKSKTTEGKCGEGKCGGKK